MNYPSNLPPEVTLRDFFAAFALAGILAGNPSLPWPFMMAPGTVPEIPGAVVQAYSWADFMLQKRSQD